jgi:hypothetical protein
LEKKTKICWEKTKNSKTKKISSEKKTSTAPSCTEPVSWAQPQVKEAEESSTPTTKAKWWAPWEKPSIAKKN